MGTLTKTFGWSLILLHSHTVNVGMALEVNQQQKVDFDIKHQRYSFQGLYSHQRRFDQKLSWF